jgi:putative polyhydroxyalkanoate system protein
MADINITRQHGMSLASARKAAFDWAGQAEKKYDMTCTHEEGITSDEYRFARSGVTGTLKVDKDAFELNAKLGFFLGAFKDKIESEIVKNLDALINHKEPVAKEEPAAGQTAVKKAATQKAAAGKA